MYHSSTQHRQQLQDWQEALTLSLLWCCHPQREHLKLFEWESIRPSSLNLKRTAEARSVLPLMYVLLYHIWNIITGYPSIMDMASHLGHPYLQCINIWYTTDQNARNFLVKFLENFKRKCVEISIIYECNLKIVKICQKCANFESGLLSQKLLRIQKVAQNLTSC